MTATRNPDDERPIKTRCKTIQGLCKCASLSSLMLLVSACYPASNSGNPKQNVEQDKSTNSISSPAKRKTATTPQRMVELQSFDLNDAQTLPKKTISELYSELLLEAKAGDPKAMRQLFLALSQCWHSMAWTESRVVPETIDPDILKASGLTREEFTARIRHNMLGQTDSTLHECQKLPEGAVGSTQQWLTSAAESGDIYAQLMYANYRDLIVNKSASTDEIEDQNETFNKTALNYLEQLANEGLPDALYSLGVAYEAGDITPKDIVRAYAYKKAYSDIYHDETNDGELKRIAREMSEDQLLEARKLVPSLH